MSVQDGVIGDANPFVELIETSYSTESGDRSSRAKIEKVYRELFPALLRFLRARTGSIEEARDIAQETFGKVLELHDLHHVKSLTGFVWKTAQNMVIDRQRQRINRRRLDPVALFEPVQQLRSPESWLEAKQQVEIIERAIDLLPATCRSVFVLRVLEERSPVEVARELGISERLVRHYAARGMEHCAEHLDGTAARWAGPE